MTHESAWDSLTDAEKQEAIIAGAILGSIEGAMAAGLTMLVVAINASPLSGLCAAFGAFLVVMPIGFFVHAAMALAPILRRKRREAKGRT